MGAMMPQIRRMRLPTQFSSLDLGSSPLVQVDWGV